MKNRVGLEKRLFTPQRAVHVIGITRRDLAHCVLLLFLFALAIKGAQESLLELWFLIIPSGDIQAVGAGSLQEVSLTMVVCSLVTLLGSRWTPEKWTPLKYFIRFWALTVLLVAVCALFSESLRFSSFDFAQFMLRTSFLSSWSLLVMLGLGFYILPFSFLQKFTLSFLVLAHNAITCWVLTGLCLQLPASLGTLMFPIFCLLFGPLLHFAWFIGFYTWALTWSRRV